MKGADIDEQICANQIKGGLDYVSGKQYYFAVDQLSCMALKQKLLEESSVHTVSVYYDMVSLLVYVSTKPSLPGPWIFLMHFYDAGC